jgi:hypothetical protein
MRRALVTLVTFWAVVDALLGGYLIGLGLR